MHPPTATSSGGSGAAFRLPRTVEPETYHLEIEPDLGTATFSGTVAIDALIHEPVSRDRPERGRAGGERRRGARLGRIHLGCTVTFDDELEQVTFRSSTELPPGPCTLTCRFTGTLNDKLRGFYRSTYTGTAGETQTIATTQFESVDARRCFPCFDEPDRKAVFEVTLIVDPDLTPSPIPRSSRATGWATSAGSGSRRP